MRAQGDKKKKKDSSATPAAGAFLFKLLCKTFDAMHSPSSLPDSSTPTLSELLYNCADRIHAGDHISAQKLLSTISAASDPAGDAAADRVAAQFARALARRSCFGAPPHLPNRENELEAYLCMNQITPFLRFCHLTANQAILDSIPQSAQIIHVLDVGIQQGVQWPPFMQAVAERPGGPPALLRITGVGSDPAALRRTGRRLHRFAATLQLPFEFNPLVSQNLQQIPSILSSGPQSASSSSQSEFLAINCVLRLHEETSVESLAGFLQGIRELNPAVVALAEREADHAEDSFLQRFNECLRHYSALFESLEATLPPKSRERFEVENVCFGREIAEIVGCEGLERRLRHRRFRFWADFFVGCGFQGLRMSEFSVSQARLLLRLHYPSEGYHLQYSSEVENCIFLGWQGTPLFTVSSWH